MQVTTFGKFPGVQPKLRQTESLHTETNEEYRILAYDQEKAKFEFIATYSRHDTYAVVINMRQVVCPRYEPLRCYTFKKNTFYPQYDAHMPLAAVDWANENCIEERKIPSAWHSERIKEAAKRASATAFPRCQYRANAAATAELTRASERDYRHAFRRGNDDLQYHI